MKKASSNSQVTELSAYDLEVATGGASPAIFSKVSWSVVQTINLRKIGAGGGSKGGRLDWSTILINPAISARF